MPLCDAHDRQQLILTDGSLRVPHMIDSGAHTSCSHADRQARALVRRRTARNRSSSSTIPPSGSLPRARLAQDTTVVIRSRTRHSQNFKVHQASEVALCCSTRFPFATPVIGGRHRLLLDCHQPAGRLGTLPTRLTHCTSFVQLASLVFGREMAGAGGRMLLAAPMQVWRSSAIVKECAGPAVVALTARAGAGNAATRCARQFGTRHLLSGPSQRTITDGGSSAAARWSGSARERVVLRRNILKLTTWVLRRRLTTPPPPPSGGSGGGGGPARGQWSARPGGQAKGKGGADPKIEFKRGTGGGAGGGGGGGGGAGPQGTPA
jgi:hypothetical protein